jgi:hypothetical protein
VTGLRPVGVAANSRVGEERGISAVLGVATAGTDGDQRRAVDGEAHGGGFLKCNSDGGVDTRSEDAVGGVIGDLGTRAKLVGVVAEPDGERRRPTMRRPLAADGATPSTPCGAATEPSDDAPVDGNAGARGRWLGGS